jgi:uncharacterized protein
MLIEFSVANFRSLDLRQSLSLVSSASAEKRETHARDTGLPSVAPLLLTAAIYGANGAGKSNLLRAFWVLRSMVINSAREGMRGDALPYEPFGLNKKLPTEFEVVFVADNKRWQYGFKYDKERVIEEYLFCYRSQKPTRVFERIYAPQDKAGKTGSSSSSIASMADSNQNYQWEFSKSIKAVQFEELVRPNALALSVLGGQFNFPELISAYDWFRQSRILNTHAQKIPWLQLPEEEALKRVFPFIQAIDPTLIKGRIKTVRHEIQIADEAPQTETMGSVEFCHQTPEGSELWIDLDEESEGTQQLYRLMDVLLSSMERGCVTLVDELDNSLHPLLARSLVALFHDKKRNPVGAQLVFATHDATMLDLNFLREDQIWFVEKKPSLSTELYSLADIKGRHTAIEKGYLQGKFGAIPLLGSPLANG